MAALGEAETRSADTAGMKSLLLGSAAALAGHFSQPNRKQRRAADAVRRRKSGQKPVLERAGRP